MGEDNSSLTFSSVSRGDVLPRYGEDLAKGKGELTKVMSSSAREDSESRLCLIFGMLGAKDCCRNASKSM